ncbi:uncharacterized protein LOC117575320 [Drosophila albomicans]|uniref:Uncharacterized protein LOC117575320 n=1 Tax=Drosophila albomicans TaxID=7291 RepID=A0A6P8XQB9_DROAB|nr:uncharacterized protein LOC117575320 [Drosophila albomicans]
MSQVEEQKSFVRISSRRDSSRSKFLSRPKTMTRTMTTTTHVPNEDIRPSMKHFTQRHTSDPRPNYRTETIIGKILSNAKYQPDDSPDLMSRQPSYRKFRIPYEMICANRYRDSLKSYEAQLKHEVKKIIDFQSSAADACYFVRCMAITSFWPPLHHMTDVKHTSKNFFQLSERERWRLQIIMNTDIT